MAKGLKGGGPLPNLHPRSPLYLLHKFHVIGFFV